MTEGSGGIEEIELEEQPEEDLREQLYGQFDVTTGERWGNRYILPILDLWVQTESRYKIDPRAKILAEISLIRAYEREPKFKLFANATVLLLIYDLLYPFNPTIYGIVFLALATLNGFLASLRSPAMMAAELEGVKDKDGMPAHYRAKALTSVNTNVTLVLFVIAVSVQLLIASSTVQGELVANNIAAGTLHPGITALVLATAPVISSRVRGNGNKD